MAAKAQSHAAGCVSLMADVLRARAREESVAQPVGGRWSGSRCRYNQYLDDPRLFVSSFDGIVDGKCVVSAALMESNW